VHSHRGRTIRAEIRTTAAPRQVWEAWADPVKIAQWFVDRAQGEPTPGSTYTWFFDKFNLALPYRVLEAAPGERFVLAWDPPPGRDPGIMEVIIGREGGSTVMSFVNSGFLEGAEWDEEYQGVVSGWQLSFSLLQHYLENYFGRPRSSFLVMQPAQFAYDELLPYYLEAGGLARWLTISGSIGRPGDHVRLALQDGSTVTGKVLALTAREVLVSCEEIGGALAFKAFSMGPGGRMAGIHGCGWDLDPAQAAAMEARMAQALGRLVAALPTANTAASQSP